METELWMLLRLGIAAIPGGVIGFERGYARKSTGLRTHMLIALAATLFVSFNELFVSETMPLAPAGPAGNFRIQIDPLTIIEAIVTGVSFLGAGIIFVSRSNHVLHAHREPPYALKSTFSNCIGSGCADTWYHGLTV